MKANADITARANENNIPAITCARDLFDIFLFLPSFVRIFFFFALLFSSLSSCFFLRPPVPVPAQKDYERSTFSMIGETRKCQEHESCPEIWSFLLRPCRRRRKEGFKSNAGCRDWPLQGKNNSVNLWKNSAAFLVKEIPTDSDNSVLSTCARVIQINAGNLLVAAFYVVE